MAGGKPRRYHSPQRKAAALATRQAVLDAAVALFADRGYQGTTLAGVGDAAGVSLATVKLIAATKAELLLEAFHSRARGDSSGVPLAERAGWKAILAERDPSRLIRRVVVHSGSIHKRQAGLFDLLRQAGSSQPQLAVVERKGGAGRRRDMRGVARALASLGALRQRVDVESATDVLWVLDSPQVYRLCLQNGWTPARWERWLCDALEAQLLRPPRNGGR